MSPKSPMGMKGLALLSEMLEKGIGNVSEKQPGTSLSPVQGVPALPLRSVQESQKTHTLQIWALLLIIICLGSLGSLSLVPYMLPSLVHHTTTRAQVHPSTPIVPTPIIGPFTESECTATPQNMKYLPTSGKTDDKTLPLTWFQAGRSQKDFANAEACAASFVITYQTFDSGHLQTLEASISMLTDGAKQRFYGNAPNTQADRHMDPMWRANLQKEQVQQVAQVGEPGLLGSQYTNGRLLVWMVVPCRLSIQVAGGKPIVEDVQFTVLLVGVPINAQGTGTGWQVSQWQDGSVLFESPAFL
jgi:hypothetical protein